MDVITKSSFENGLTETEWLSVLQASPDYPSLASTTSLQLSILKSIFDLLVIWPANQSLIEYLATLLRSRLIPLHVFTPSILRSTRRLDFQDPRTLDMLFELAVTISREMPMEVPVNVVDPVEPVALTLLDAYQILRVSLPMPYTPLHKLSASASDVLLLLLQSTRSIIPQLTPPEAFQFYTLGSEIMQHPTLNTALLHAIDETNRLLGDAYAAADVLPPTHSEMLGMGLPPADSSPVGTSDIASCSLFLRNSVDYRTHPFGCGNTDRTVSILIGLYKWSGSNFSSFCSEVVQAAVLNLLHAFQLRMVDPLGARIWTSFVYGRLPTLIQGFLEHAGSSQQQQSSLQAAMATVCEKVQGQLEFAAGFQPPSETDDQMLSFYNPMSFTFNFLHSLVDRGVLSTATAKTVKNDWTENKPQGPLSSELGDSPIERLVDRLIEGGTDERRKVLDAFVLDIPLQQAVSEALLTKFIALSTSQDFTSLSYLCEALGMHAAALDIIALYVSMPRLLLCCLQFLEGLDWENTDDPQTTIGPFGAIVLFLQASIGRYKLPLAALMTPDRSISADYLMQAGTMEQAAMLAPEERVTYSNWYKTLFDMNSEGIDDVLVRSTNPKLLLKLAPILVSEAIAATQVSGRNPTALETLRNGINYFQESVLSWTLMGVVRCVALQMERAGPHTPVHAEVLQQLLKDAPDSLFRLVGRTLKRVAALPVDEETAKARSDLVKTLEAKLPGSQPPPMSSYSHKLAPSSLLRAAVVTIRSNRAVSLDVPLCVRLLRPIEFLFQLHKELFSSNQLSEPESSRCLVSFVLSQAAQSSPDQPWLLPLYTTYCIPRIVSQLGQQDSLLIDTIATVITSAFRLCLLLDKASGAAIPEPTTLVCQQFSQRLKALINQKTTNGASLLWKSLGAAQPFVAQFPYFA